MTIKLEDKGIELGLGKTEAWVNNISEIMDTPPQIINDRMMLPVRFVSGKLDCTVNWEQEDQSTTIIQK